MISLSKDHEYIKGNRHNKKSPEDCETRKAEVDRYTRLGYSARGIAIKLGITDRTAIRYRNHPPKRAGVES